MNYIVTQSFLKIQLIVIGKNLKKKLLTTKKILGIDPGTNIMGFGLIEVKNQQINLLELDVLLLGKVKDPDLKLKKIYEKTISLIDSYKPNELAIEAPFFGKNIQSMLKLGRAQGVAMVAGINKNIPIFEYAPKKIKLAVTGRGQSSKEQVASMLMYMLNIKEKPKYLDSTDGLAVAVCHALQKNISSEKKTESKNWSEFIKKNPNRII